jgi:F-type H+-transporting ATPase subunit epsilon/F-type H+-transporting ATPase subunit delta
MSEEFKVEIVNPEKSFLINENVTEVVVPAFEGEMGILKDHISIISFLKPGIIKVYSKSVENKYFVEDGIVEFKDNSLSILTSSIYNMSDLDRNKIDQIVKEAEREVNGENIDDQKRYLIDQKIEVLKNLNLN